MLNVAENEELNDRECVVVLDRVGEGVAVVLTDMLSVAVGVCVVDAECDDDTETEFDNDSDIERLRERENVFDLDSDVDLLMEIERELEAEFEKLCDDVNEIDEVSLFVLVGDRLPVLVNVADEVPDLLPDRLFVKDSD